MKTLNVVIADDVESWLYLNKKNVEDFLKNIPDLNIYTFKSANDTYHFVAGFKDKIDLVISDLEMEPIGENTAGEWLINNLKTLNATKNSKYIIVSAHSNISLIAQKLQADGFLHKSSYAASNISFIFLLQEIFGEQNG